jgi:hypothetical protein
LLHALEDDDAEAAAPLATELHDGWHDFDAGVQTELFGDLPPDAGGVEEHGEEMEGTPHAEGTTEADHDEDAEETATP